MITSIKNRNSDRLKFTANAHVQEILFYTHIFGDKT